MEMLVGKGCAMPLMKQLFLISTMNLPNWGWCSMSYHLPLPRCVWLPCLCGSLPSSWTATHSWNLSPLLQRRRNPQKLSCLHHPSEASTTRPSAEALKPSLEERKCWRLWTLSQCALPPTPKPAPCHLFIA